jgi:hypothetical protein
MICNSAVAMGGLIVSIVFCVQKLIEVQPIFDSCDYLQHLTHECVVSTHIHRTIGLVYFVQRNNEQ